MKKIITAALLIVTSSVYSYAKEDAKDKNLVTRCVTTYGAQPGDRSVILKKISKGRFEVSMTIREAPFRALPPISVELGVMHLSNDPSQGKSTYYMAPIRKDGQLVKRAMSNEQLVVRPYTKARAQVAIMLQPESKYYQPYLKRGGDNSGALFCNASMDDLLK